MKREILSVTFDNVTMEEALERASALAREGKSDYIVTPNSEIVYEARKNEALAKALKGASLVIPDGIGVVYASKILSKPLKQKVAGIELGERLIEYASLNGLSVYLFGAKPGIAERAKDKLCEKYPGLNVAGVQDGYFKDGSDREREIIEDINSKAPNILIACLGVPKQELWMNAHKDELNVRVMLGLGGSMDIYAGVSKRAPDIFIKLSLEWFYRLCKEPWRIKRMIKLPLFLLLAVKVRLFGEK
ncbi:MAG: WecB/TagA/CpsF family glycosyltransferase [Clostridiales bacterium]|nr:WecB/TagA/CpsF family glycosyltransferase [Clostridiales bacterium]